MAEAAHDLYNPEDSDENPLSDLKSRESDLQRPKLRVIQGGLKNGEASKSGANVSDDQAKADNPFQLANKEAGASAVANGSQEEVDDRLGKGFTGGKGKSNPSGLWNKIPGSSKAKKWVIFSCAAAAGAITTAVIGFLLLIPLKVVSIVTNLENHFSSTTSSALSSESDNLLNNYYKKYIISNPIFGTSVCHTTASPQCVAGISGNNPISKLYQSWKQNHLETQLADKYGVAFGRQGNTLYMNIDGVMAGDTNIRTFLKEQNSSIFDLPGTKAVSAIEARQALDSRLKDASLWDKAYFRFKFSTLLKEKYGINLCVIRCIINDNYSYPLSNKVAAAKAQIALRVISPLSQSYGLMMACLILGNCQDLTAPKPATEENPEALTEFQSELQSELQSLAETDPAALSAVFAKVSTISQGGFAKSLLSDVVKNVAARLSGPAAGDAAAESVISSPATQAAGDAAADSVPGLGWVLAIAQVINTIHNAAQSYTKIRYAVTAAAAVKLFMSYSSVSSEIQSGHVDPTEVGSFTNSLGTNISGSNTDQLDASQAPLYQYLNNGTMNNKLPTNPAYKCANGDPVPSGQLVCQEESLTANNGVLGSLDSVVSAVPGLTTVAGAISFISGIITGSITSIPGVGWVVGELGSIAGGLLNALCTTNLGCVLLKNEVASWVPTIIGHIVQTPFTDNMDGGRTYDMMAAGADVSNNDSCREQLGCARLTTQQAATIQNQQLTSEKMSFDNQSMFARVFDTSSPFSLVSKLAAVMPTNIPVAINNTASSILSNPLGTIASVFSNIFTSDKAFAAIPAQPDPFGVIQYGYEPSQIPSDPENYWNANCQTQDPGQTNLDTLTSVIQMNWENTQQQDQTTGESVATTPSPCLLILSTIQSDGAMFDTSLAPAGSLNPDP